MSTIVIYLALLVCLLGLLVWALCVKVSRAWLGDAARIAYAVGLLAFLMTTGATVSTCNGCNSSLHK